MRMVPETGRASGPGGSGGGWTTLSSSESSEHATSAQQAASTRRAEKHRERRTGVTSCWLDEGENRILRSVYQPFGSDGNCYVRDELERGVGGSFTAAMMSASPSR